MGLLSGLLGNVTEVSAERLDKLFSDVLVPDENIEKAYQLVRDLAVFTNKRLVLVDKQGMTGKKVQFLSIPYSKVAKFSKEGAGHFDLEAELKIWVGSEKTPVDLTFSRSVNINEVYRVLSTYVLR